MLLKIIPLLFFFSIAHMKSTGTTELKVMVEFVTWRSGIGSTREEENQSKVLSHPANQHHST